MAKDDYHVIVYQILCYLYNVLKKGEALHADSLRHEGDFFKIPESYWLYIMVNLLGEGYVSGITVSEKMNTMGEKVLSIQNLDQIQITPKGIEYLTDNTFMKKALRFVNEAKSLIPFDLFS